METRSQRTFRRIGAFARIGAVAGIAGIGIAARKAFSEFEEAEKATKQTDAVLKSTGAVAGVTAKQVEKLAQAISLKTGIDDEAIQSAENLLLTFTSVRNEVGKGNDIFSQATSIINDMSVALGQDLKSSTIQVGKALQDPIKGITALRRVGVNFNAQQTEQVKKMVESGRQMDAQKFILRELNKEFEGSAAAQATSSEKMKVAIDNILESLGRSFAPALEKAAKGISDFLNDVNKVFQRTDLTPGQKWDRLGDMIGAKIDKALPRIAEAVARIGPKIALVFVKSLLNAPPLIQLLTGAWLLKKAGPLLAAAGLLGRQSGAAFSTGMATTVATGGAGGAAGGAAGGLAAFGAKLAKFAKVGVGVATGAAILEGIRLRLQSPDAGLEKRLKELQAPGALGVRKLIGGAQNLVAKIPGVPKPGRDDFGPQIEKSKELQKVLDQLNSASGERIPILQRQAAELARQLDLTQAQKAELSLMFKLKATGDISKALGGITEASRTAQDSLPAVVAAQKRVNELQEQGKTGTHAYAVAIRTLDAAEATRNEALRARTGQQTKALAATKADLSTAIQTFKSHQRLGASEEQLAKDMSQVEQAASRQHAALANVSRATRGLTPIAGAAGTKMGELLKSFKGIEGVGKFKKFLVTADISSVEKGISVASKLQKLGRGKTVMKVFAESKTSEEALKRLRELLRGIERKKTIARIEARDDATLFALKVRRGLTKLFENPIKAVLDFVAPPPPKRRATGGVIQEALSLVGEQGFELAKFPTGQMAMLGQEGPEVRALPVGTRVFSHPETKRKLASVTQKVVQRLVPAVIPQPQSLVQRVVQEGPGTDRGRQSPRPLLSEAARSLRTPRFVGLARKLGIPGFARGGTVGKEPTAKASKKLPIRELLERIWTVAAPFYGQSVGAALPPTGIVKSFQTSTLTDAAGKGERVYIHRDDARGLLRGKPRDMSNVIHEWAHYFQNPKLRKDWKVEGGAEAFARSVAPDIYGALEMPYASPSLEGAYAPFVRRVRKEKGQSWVMRGQFGRERTDQGGDSDKPGRRLAKTSGKPEDSIQSIVGLEGAERAEARERHYKRIRDAIFKKWRTITHSKPPRDYDIGEFLWRGLAIAPSNELGEKLGWSKGKRPGSTTKVRKPPPWIPKQFWSTWNKGEGYKRPYVLGADAATGSRRIAKTSQLAGVSVTPNEVTAIANKWGVNRAVASIGAAVKDKFPLMDIISGFRSGATTKSGSRSNHAIRAALDLGARGSLNRRIGSWVRSNFPNSLRGVTEGVLDIDHDPNPPDHADHVHVAAAGSQAITKVMESVGGDGPGEKKRRITGGRLSLGQMVTLAKKVKFPDPALAAAIGYAESRGQVAAVGDGGDSLGLWQINTPAHPRYDKDRLQHDAFYNARAALAISRKGKSFQPWTQYRNAAYKQFLGGRGAPLPKGTSKSVATGSSFADYLEMKILDSEDTLRPSDDLKWINRALRYWRGVYRRNKRSGNFQRATEAKGQINILKEKRAALKPEEPDYEELGALAPSIGVSDLNTFDTRPFENILSGLQLDKAKAALTLPRDDDESQAGIAASLQDDIDAKSRFAGVWEQLYNLTQRFVPSRGSFKFTTKQLKWINAPKDVPERYARAKQIMDEGLKGTVEQQIFAAENLASARSDLKGDTDEAGRKEETSSGESLPGEKVADRVQDVKSFLAEIAELLKLKSNITPLQSFAGGGVIQGPKGKPVTVEAHGGEVVFDPNSGRLTIVVDKGEGEKAQQIVKNIDARSYFQEVPKKPHAFSRAVAFELEAAV